MPRLIVLLLALAPWLARAVDVPADPLATLRTAHPRLLLTDEQLAAATAAARSDPLRAQLHSRVLALAETELKAKPIERVLVGPRLLGQSRTAVGRVLTCALAYRLGGDARFARRAIDEMLTAAAFADWNPSHFLDVAEMSFALAVGYDWLHAQLSASERARIKAALLGHALKFARDAYHPARTTGRPDDRRLWFVTAHHNWNQVCNGGLLAAALALAEDEPDLARLVVAGVAKSLPLAMKAYEPDGAYPEGPGYWSYGTTYNVLALALLESALGTDFGLGKLPAFDRTALYRLQVEGPTGLGFNYADGSPGLGASPAYTWLATRYAHPHALAHSRALLEAAAAPRRNDRTSDRFFALHAAWFPAPRPSPSPSAPLDVRFRGPAEIAILRSAWSDPRGLFVGFKAGRNDVNHSHLDLGSFVLEADGVRWVHDLGPDDYNLPAYFGAKRWTYFRLNNHSHNTLTPGDALQNPKAAAPIVAFASTPARSFAVADLTAAYPGAARRMTRGIALLDRARVLVQDDVIGLQPGTPLVWRMVTAARVKLDTSRAATLTQDRRTLRAEILAPANARFSTRPAKPASSAEKQNQGHTVLSAEVPFEKSDVQLVVLLTPVGDHWPAQSPPVTVTPLEAWR